MQIYKIVLFFILSFACFVAGFFAGQNSPRFTNQNKKISALSDKMNNVKSITNQDEEDNFSDKIKRMQQETEELKQHIQQQAQNQKEYQKSYEDLEQESRQELNEKIKEKNKMITKRQAEYDKKNRQWLLNLPKEQNYFYWKGKYSVLINVFSDEEKALAYIKKLKKSYPLWNFFIKLDKLANIKIYLGPFETRNRALEFIKSLPYPSPFPNHFLEEQSL